MPRNSGVSYELARTSRRLCGLPNQGIMRPVPNGNEH